MYRVYGAQRRRMKKQQKSDLAKRLGKIDAHTTTARAVAGQQTREHDDSRRHLAASNEHASSAKGRGLFTWSPHLRLREQRNTADATSE